MHHTWVGVYTMKIQSSMNFMQVKENNAEIYTQGLFSAFKGPKLECFVIITPPTFLRPIWSLVTGLRG